MNEVNEMTVKTIGEQITDLENTRKAKAARMRELTTKASSESRSLDTGEAEEFDTLNGECKALDRDISRLMDLENIEKSTAAPAEPKASEKASAAAVQYAGRVEVKNTEKLEPGIAFARYARVKAISHIERVDAGNVAKTLYPSDEKLYRTITKADVPAANTLSPTWAGNLINEGGVAFADFVEYLRPRTLVGRIQDRLRRLPFDAPVIVQATRGSAAWVKEGDAKPLTDWTYTRAKLTPLKVAAIAAATKEMLMRSSASVDALVRDELARALGETIDTTFISAVGVSPDESPAGILNGTGALTLTGGTDYDSVRCDVATFLNAFADNNNSLAGTFWVMPERVAIALSLMTNPLGQTAFPGVEFTGGTFFGIPVFVTNYADTDSSGSVVALVKGDEIYYGDDGGIDVSVTDQATLTMSDAPAGDSITPTASGSKLVSLWQTNSIAWRVERVLNWQKRRSEAVAWARVNWGACDAVSP
jgi:HK97 family phage major capsid protein